MWIWVIIITVALWALGRIKQKTKKGSRRNPRRLSSDAIDGVERNLIRLADEAERYAHNHALDSHQRSEAILRKKYTAAIKQAVSLVKFGGQVEGNLTPNGLFYWAKSHKRDDLIRDFVPEFKRVGVETNKCLAYWTTGDGGNLIKQYDDAAMARELWEQKRKQPKQRVNSK